MAAGKKPTAKKPRSIGPQDATTPEQLAADALLLALDPSRAQPELPAAEGSSRVERTLPLAPPPPLRGAVVDVPPPLRPLFGGSGSPGGRLLQRLMRDAVAGLDAATALGVPHGGSGPPQASEGQPPADTLAVSPDIDFGTVPVSRLAAGQLVEAAAAAAAGLPRDASSSSGGSSSGFGTAAAGSLLDLLHLASSPQQQGGTAATPLPGGAPLTAASGAEAQAGGPVLHFRQLVIDNCSSCDELWLLGGVAAPAFPHTLAAIDDARLFWLEGGRAGAGAQGCMAVGQQSGHSPGAPPGFAVHACTTSLHAAVVLPCCRPPSGAAGPQAAAHDLCCAVLC